MATSGPRITQLVVNTDTFARLKLIVVTVKFLKNIQFVKDIQLFFKKLKTEVKGRILERLCISFKFTWKLLYFFRQTE